MDSDLVGLDAKIRQAIKSSKWQPNPSWVIPVKEDGYQKGETLYRSLALADFIDAIPKMQQQQQMKKFKKMNENMISNMANGASTEVQKLKKEFHSSEAADGDFDIEDIINNYVAKTKRAVHVITLVMASSPSSSSSSSLLSARLHKFEGPDVGNAAKGALTLLATPGSDFQHLYVGWRFSVVPSNEKKADLVRPMIVANADLMKTRVDGLLVRGQHHHPAALSHRLSIKGAFYG